MEQILGNLAADADRPGDRTAQFEAIYRAHLRRVLNYVRYRVPGAAVAEDVTADIFTSVFQSLDRYDAGQGSLTSWLFTIARRRLADHFRRMGRALGDLPLDAALDRPDETDVQATVTKSMELERVVRSIGLLSERDREVIALRIGAELSSNDVAARLGMTRTNVDVSLHRALKRLKSLVTDGEAQ